MARCAVCRLPVGGPGAHCFECELELRACEEAGVSDRVPGSGAAEAMARCAPPPKRARRAAVVRATARQAAPRRVMPQVTGPSLSMRKILAAPECPICFCAYELELDAPRMPLRTACCTGHVCGECGPRAAPHGTRCPLCAKPDVRWNRDIDAACSLRALWRCERCGVRVRGADMAEHTRGASCASSSK